MRGEGGCEWKGEDEGEAKDESEGEGTHINNALSQVLNSKEPVHLSSLEPPSPMYHAAAIRQQLPKLTTSTEGEVEQCCVRQCTRRHYVAATQLFRFRLLP